jgi:PAS domain S-box-containing protein
MSSNQHSAAEEFRAVADYTYDWESWHSADGQLVWVNPAVERTTGYTIAECLAMERYPLPIIIPDDRERMAKVMESARNRTTGENVEFRCRHTSGETHWMSMAWQPICDLEGAPLGFRTSVRDITELQKLREQLQLYTDHLEQLVQERSLKLRELEQRQLQMEKLAALGQLAAGVAHEINNPLAGIRNAFELIKSSLSPDNEHYELLELIDREFDRISSIIHQMYQLHRRGPQEPTTFFAEQTVGDVVSLLESVARKGEVTLRFDAGAPQAMVTLPEGEVKQILYNVIRNAIQASPREGTVEIDLQPDHDVIRISVTDHGAGIPDDIRLRIFEPFFSTKQGQPQAGMGLGLSVTRSLIDAMGGRVDLETTPGKGTCFKLTFPKRSPAPEESQHG